MISSHPSEGKKKHPVWPETARFTHRPVGDAMSEQPEEVEPERTPENSLDIDALWQKAELTLKERLEMFHHVPSYAGNLGQRFI